MVEAFRFEIKFDRLIWSRSLFRQFNQSLRFSRLMKQSAVIKKELYESETTMAKSVDKDRMIQRTNNKLATTDTVREFDLDSLASGSAK